MIGLIGGYGIEKLLERAEQAKAECIFDREAVKEFVYYKGSISGKAAIIIPRHGKGHELPPHRIPYRSYIATLKELGAERIITINSAGILKGNYRVNSFFLPKDFINFAPEITFFERFEVKAVHTPMGEPYDKKTGAIIERVAKGLGLRVYSNVVYVNVRGPRLETKAEIRLYAGFGDIIGMTNAYEVILANEKGIPISTICLGVNYAEGLGESVSMERVKAGIERMKKDLFRLLEGVIEEL